MSNGKRFALPTQKGQELFPKVSQQPTKLVIKNVPPETPLYRAVANIFAGRLKAFHAKAQQQYALSNNQQHRVMWSWGDARATYLNQFGIETLTLEVSQETLEAIFREQLKRDKWYWARVDFTLPINKLYGAYIYAEIRDHPEISTMRATGNGLGAPLTYATTQKINFAGGDGIDLPQQIIPDATDVTFSLLVDLRTDFEHPTGLIIDIFGLAGELDHVLAQWRVSKTHSASMWEWETGASPTLTQLKSDWVAHGLPQSYSYVTNLHTEPFGVAGVYPEPPPEFNLVTGVPPTIDNEWQYMEITYDDRGFPASLGWAFLGWSDDESFIIYRGTFAVDYFEATPQYGDVLNPDIGPGSIYGASFPFDLDWKTRRWDATPDFVSYRWLPSNIEGPEWVKLNKIANEVRWPNTYYGSASLNINDPAYKIGTLTADRVSGALSFTPAG